MRAGLKLVTLCAGHLAFMCAAAVPAGAQELSEKAVKSFMDYAWSLTPQQFSRGDGTVVQIDKKKRDEVMVPIETARDAIMAGRLSAHAQVCELKDEQIINHRALMAREEDKKKWTPQQLVYISQLHLTTVMMLTGKVKLVEKEGDKEVVVDETKPTTTTCTDEQRGKVRERIAAYANASPKFSLPAEAANAIKGDGAPVPPPSAAAAAAAAAAKPIPPAATGSTNKAPAAKPAAAAAAAPAQPAAAKPAAAAPAPAAKPATPAP